jgi:hypothetical protein
MSGPSIKTTLELWASSLRDVKSARKTQALPPVIGMAIGARDHVAVQHREIDRPLDVEPEVAIRQQPAQHIAATEVLPQAAMPARGREASIPDRGRC